MIHWTKMLKKTLKWSAFDYCLILLGCEAVQFIQNIVTHHIRKSSLLLEKLHHFENIRATVTLLKMWLS